MDDNHKHPSNSGEMYSAAPARDERAVFRKRVLKIGGVLILVWVALFTLPIPFGSLKIIGSDKVTVQDVMVAGDIREPVNILQISTEKLKSRLSKDLRVEEAQVSYELPLTMVVRIVERKAVAVIPAQFGYLTLDAKGQVIASESAIEDTSVPMISGVKAGNILLGDTVVDQPILSAIEYLNALDESTFKNIAEINIGDPESIMAYTVSGIQIRIGDGKDLAKKAELTQSMLQDIKKTNGNIQYIDVNISSPYIKTDVMPEGKPYHNGATTKDASSTKKDDIKKDDTKTDDAKKDNQGHVENKR